MTSHKITECYTEWFSVCPNITSKFHTIAVFKIFIKLNIDWNKTLRYVHDLLLCQISFAQVHWFMTCLHKTKYTINCIFQNRPPRPYFWFFIKTVSLKVATQLRTYQHTKFRSPTLIGANFASTSEAWTSVIYNGWSQGIWINGHKVTFNLTEFHKNVLIASKVIRGDRPTHG
jgi:hypothetical protein